MTETRHGLYDERANSEKQTRLARARQKSRGGSNLVGSGTRTQHPCPTHQQFAVESAPPGGAAEELVWPGCVELGRTIDDAVQMSRRKRSWLPWGERGMSSGVITVGLPRRCPTVLEQKRGTTSDDWSAFQPTRQKGADRVWGAKEVRGVHPGPLPANKADNKRPRRDRETGCRPPRPSVDFTRRWGDGFRGTIPPVDRRCLDTAAVVGWAGGCGVRGVGWDAGQDSSSKVPGQPGTQGTLRSILVARRGVRRARERHREQGARRKGRGGERGWEHEPGSNAATCNPYRDLGLGGQGSGEGRDTQWTGESEKGRRRGMKEASESWR